MRLIAILLVTLAHTVCLASDWDPPNLVQNPGFEQVDQKGAPDAWGADMNVYTTVSSPAHSGNRALQFINPNPGRYILCSQQLPLEPGSMYQFSAWVKTEGVTGEDNGATVCMEFYDADGGYLGGSYPAGFKGDTDWRQVKAIGKRVPDKAARCSVTCYVRKGMTGKAWWDDVSVTKWREAPLKGTLISPGYRGQILRATKSIELAVSLSLRDYDLTLGDCRVRLELIGKAKGKVVRVDELTPRSDKFRMSMPATRMGLGDHELKLSLVHAADGDEIASEKWNLSVPRPADVAGRAAYIDDHKRLILNGQPFFPLGMYWGGINEADIKTYADSAFNCLMPYGAPDTEKMDLAHQFGLKVIYSIKDIYHGSNYCPEGIKTAEDERAFIEGKAATYRDHPALLAWYLNDELPLEYMDRLEAHQQWMEELDPGHPTWVVLYQVGALDQYSNTCDVMGTDPYPIPTSPARRAAEWTRTTIDAFHGSKAVWMVPQVFNWAVYRKTPEQKEGMRPPTFEEMRSMAWQCIAEGANGLIFYSFMDIKRDAMMPFEEQWPNVKRMAQEISDMAPVLLSVEETPEIAASPREWLHWTVRQVGDKTYLIVVNDEGKRHKKTFNLGSDPETISLQDSEEPVELRAGSLLTVEFEPFGVYIYEIGF